ncbi:hypothetical protein KUV89_15305 [Marinobacter hydrocarbonoclasticus]|nr:hypothetical protein [Marinobacter nauticus]
MKTGLIIQGPLLSRGRTGKTVGIPLKQVTEQDVVDFNCVDTITRMVNECESRYDAIVVATWKTEDPALIEALAQRIGHERILLLEDNTKAIAPRTALVGGNNKYRQFYSMLKGLEALEAQGCELAVKVRTDQYGDYVALADQLEAAVKQGPEKVMIPWLDVRKPMHLVDFYFGGTTAHLKALCKRYFAKPEAYELVHLDLFYHWTWDIPTWALPFYKLLIGKRMNPLNSAVIRTGWDNAFWLSSRQVAQSLVWRGEPFDLPNPERLRFAEDGDKLKQLGV